MRRAVFMFQIVQKTVTLAAFETSGYKAGPRLYTVEHHSTHIGRKYKTKRARKIPRPSRRHLHAGLQDVTNPA
jgi:hypothetical protein